MKKLKILIIILLTILIVLPTVYRLNSFENGFTVVRGIAIDIILNITDIKNIDIGGIVQLVLSSIIVTIFIVTCCNYKRNTTFIILSFTTLLLSSVSVIWSFITSMQLRSYMTVFGIIANIIPLLLLIAIYIIFAIGITKQITQRTTKTQCSQKQVDESRKGE